MAYKLLNQYFYPDITNIILDYLTISKQECKEEYTKNVYYLDNLFEFCLKKTEYNLPYTVMMDRLLMIKRVNKMLARIDKF
jgi:hypothetical protein